MSRGASVFAVFLALACPLARAQTQDDEPPPGPPAVEAPVPDEPPPPPDPGDSSLPVATQPAIPDDATLEAQGAMIGNITIHAGSIFDLDDPKENKAVFRGADKLHRTTREHVIRRQLTFATGDCYSRAALDESERMLRHNGYLYDAKIRPVSYDGHTVDIGVWTRDVWTLRPAAGFRRAGGVNVFHFGIHDSNFLGLGKNLGVERVNGIDRNQTIFAYLDPSLAGSHARLSLGYSNNSDGKGTLFDLDRPFWRKDELWAGGVHHEMNEQTDSLYALGEITDQFHEKMTLASGYFGKRMGAPGNTVKRLLVGYTYDQSLFSRPAPIDPTLPPPPPAPPDRTLSYPWIGVNIYRDGYIQAHDLDKLGRTEDINLGLDLLARFGWATPILGADRNAAIMDFTFNTGFTPGQGQIITLGGTGKGRIGADADVQDGRIDITTHYYNRKRDALLFFMGLTGSAAAHLDPDHQLLLGGDNGLRGYPLRYALGDRSLLLTLEERFYLNKEIFHLLRLGAAVFADVGKAWGEMPDPAAHLGVLKDVGVGFRIGQTRSAHAAVVRIDVAVPIDMPGAGLHPQIVVKTGETF